MTAPTPPIPQPNQPAVALPPSPTLLSLPNELLLKIFKGVLQDNPNAGRDYAALSVTCKRFRDISVDREIVGDVNHRPLVRRANPQTPQEKASLVLNSIFPIMGLPKPANVGDNGLSDLEMDACKPIAHLLPQIEKMYRRSHLRRSAQLTSQIYEHARIHRYRPPAVNDPELEASIRRERANQLAKKRRKRSREERERSRPKNQTKIDICRDGRLYIAPGDHKFIKLRDLLALVDAIAGAEREDIPKELRKVCARAEKASLAPHERVEVMSKIAYLAGEEKVTLVASFAFSHALNALRLCQDPKSALRQAHQLASKKQSQSHNYNFCQVNVFNCTIENVIIGAVRQLRDPSYAARYTKLFTPINMSWARTMSTYIDDDIARVSVLIHIAESCLK